METLIGDISPPADLMKTLTDRKIAEREKLTFNAQMAAQGGTLVDALLAGRVKHRFQPGA